MCGRGSGAGCLSLHWLSTAPAGTPAPGGDPAAAPALSWARGSDGALVPFGTGLQSCSPRAPGAGAGTETGKISLGAAGEPQSHHWSPLQRQWSLSWDRSWVLLQTRLEPPRAASRRPHVPCPAPHTRGRLLAAPVRVFSVAGRQVTFHESICEFLSKRRADPLELIK